VPTAWRAGGRERAAEDRISRVETAALVLVDVALVLAVSGALRRVLCRLRQPPVMADILAGLVLGATLLGTLPGDPSDALFTADARSVLGALGEAAIVAYLFTAAARFDRTALGRERRIVGAVAVGSFVVPGLAGAGLAVAVHGTVAATRRLPRSRSSLARRSRSRPCRSWPASSRSGR
jgi:Kef-type K+ transport system membrane component KefB